MLCTISLEFGDGSAYTCLIFGGLVGVCRFVMLLLLLWFDLRVVFACVD